MPYHKASYRRKYLDIIAFKINWHTKDNDKSKYWTLFLSKKKAKIFFQKSINKYGTILNIFWR